MLPKHKALKSFLARVVSVGNKFIYIQNISPEENIGHIFQKVRKTTFIFHNFNDPEIREQSEPVFIFIRDTTFDSKSV